MEALALLLCSLSLSLILSNSLYCRECIIIWYCYCHCFMLLLLYVIMMVGVFIHTLCTINKQINVRHCSIYIYAYMHIEHMNMYHVYIVLKSDEAFHSTILTAHYNINNRMNCFMAFMCHAIRCRRSQYETKKIFNNIRSVVQSYMEIDR